MRTILVDVTDEIKFSPRDVFCCCCLVLLPRSFSLVFSFIWSEWGSMLTWQLIKICSLCTNIKWRHDKYFCVTWARACAIFSSHQFFTLVVHSNWTNAVVISTEFRYFGMFAWAFWEEKSYMHLNAHGKKNTIYTFDDFVFLLVF